jgi:CubicO group peptidase (beta-lactamase class C family)
MSTRALLPATERALLHRLAAEQAEARVPALVGGVIRDSELVWFGGRGTIAGAAPTADTQYRIGSITKTFVAVEVMRLRDEGKVDLSDPLERHVPGTSIGDRTVAQLLAHTSGLPAESPGEWWERTPGMSWTGLADALGPEPRQRREGWHFHYSNLGFATLGELISRIRGLSWIEAIRAEILDPLGLARTTPMPEKPHADGWAVHPWADVLLPEPAHDHVAMAPAGQLWSTITDLGRWAAFLGGDTGDVLDPDTLEEMRSPSTTHGADAEAGFGLGIQLRHEQGRILAGHGGSMPGFLAFVLADPQERTGVAVLANATTGLSGELSVDLLRIVTEREPRIADEWAPQPDVDPELLELAGPWYWGPSPYVLRLRAGRWLDLAPLGRGSRASRFRPEADGTWTGLDGYYSGETLRVVRRPDGTVSHLDLATFIFTRTPYDAAAAIPGDVDPDGWRAGHQ